MRLWIGHLHSKCPGDLEWEWKLQWENTLQCSNADDASSPSTGGGLLLWKHRGCEHCTVGIGHVLCCYYCIISATVQTFLCWYTPTHSLKPCFLWIAAPISLVLIIVIASHTWSHFRMRFEKDFMWLVFEVSGINSAICCEYYVNTSRHITHIKPKSNENSLEFSPNKCPGISYIHILRRNGKFES